MVSVQGVKSFPSGIFWGLKIKKRLKTAGLFVYNRKGNALEKKEYRRFSGRESFRLVEESAGAVGR